MTDKCKLTIIPTKNWLIPISLLSSDTTNKVMLAELIDEGRVVVRISNINKMLDIYKNIENIKIKNLLLNQSRFIVKIFCTFECDEDKISLLNYYEKDKSFCNANSKPSEKVMIEVMKKMSDTIQYMANKLNTNQTKEIIRYLLFIVLHLFNEFGFIHNDIHAGNIFIKIHKNEHKIKFNLDKEYILNSKLELFLGDTEDSIIYSKPIFNYIKDNDFLFTRHLGKNILQVFSSGILLLKDDLAKEILLEYNKHINFHDKKFIKQIKEYQKTSDYDLFIRKSLKYGIGLANKLFIILFNESFIEL